MKDLFDDLFSGLLAWPTPIDRTEINGWIVSTVITTDEGQETAIIDGNNRAHPVERYKTTEEAVAGHEKWRKICKNMDTLTVEEITIFGKGDSFFNTITNERTKE